ncbi:MAG: diacylglycerol kinase family lipid kinase [Clostridia bacterium]|nr:diacylglycerol kinase family lipid kinase [Clostridia bacterium]
MSKQLLLILNPISGKKIGKRHLSDVVEQFCRADYIPTVFVTTERGDACRLACTHGGGADLVVCLGGDGTFNEVVAGMLDGGHTTPMGYIPCGSTNDFASSIGLKKTIPAATAAILNGSPHAYDVGRFGERYFSYVASFGVFSRTSYATPQNVKNALGHLAYLLEGVKELSNIRPWHVRFEVDGTVVEGDYVFGAVSNATSVGGVLTLDPETVDMNDGMLELLLVKMPRNPVELSECVLALAEQRYDTDAITFVSGSDFTVTAAPTMEWSLDGEWGSGAETIHIRNLRDAITLIH